MGGARRVVLAALLVAVAAACGGGERNRSATHVVLISIDCLNQRQLAEGIRAGIAPALAALQRESIVFTRAYTHAPWTAPSHASMLTGLYPRQHGRTTPYRAMLADDGATVLVPSHPNLAETLAAAGYETVAFVGKGPIAARYGFGRGFERFEESAKNDRDSDLPGIVEGFRDWIAEGGDAPFFLLLHTFDFHSPRPVSRLEDSEALAYIDRHLGTVIAELKQRGLYETALIVLTGDHGSKMIRTRGKCCVHGAGHYEENLRVPLLVKLPHSTSVMATESLARHVDIFPTVAGVVGIEIPDYRGPGVSLVDLASGRVRTRYSFSEADARCAMRYALVSQRYKYIFTPQGAIQQKLRSDPGFRDKYCVGSCSALPKREEFFDLQDDPFEESDLLLRPLDPEPARELAAMRLAFRDHARLAPLYERRTVDPKLAPALDHELDDALRVLGYLD